MSKHNIKSLDKMKFTKLAENREEHYKGVSPVPKKVSTLKANVIAAALHPAKQNLIVKEIIAHNENTKSFKLAADTETGTVSLAYPEAGQYLSITLEINGALITRPYSLSSSPMEAKEGTYMITVRRVDGGFASNFILDNWVVGTKVVASAPLGVFTYEPLRDAKTVIAWAGGSGITPFRSLAKAVADGTEDFKMILLYGSRTLEDAIFTEEFLQLEAKCKNFKIVNVLSEEERPECEHGFITAELIKKYAPENEDYSIFMCGPQAMYKFADSELDKLAIRHKFIRRELFGEYRHPECDAEFPQGAAGEYTLTVRMCGEVTKIPCTSEETLLVAMERAGIAAPSRCRSGICGYCHSKLVDGNVYVPKTVDGRRLADFKFGYIHPCVTFPVSDVVIEVPPVVK